MLAQVGYIKSNTLDEVQLQDVIMDIVTGAIRSTDVNVDLYRWSDCPTFTKSQQPITTSPLDSYTERMVPEFCPTRGGRAFGYLSVGYFSIQLEL